MSEAKHTPGPWRTRSSGNTGRRILIEQVNGAGVIVCVVDTNLATNAANAELIASGPALLLFAKDVIEHCAKDLPAWLEADGRAAIAKAKGGQ